MIQSGERKVRGYRPGPSGDWRQAAACKGLADQYFDPWDSDDRAQVPNATAAHICQSCPVRPLCLIEAIVNDEPNGVWGGLTRKQRKSLVRARKRETCPICAGSPLTNIPGTNTQICTSCGISWRKFRETATAGRQPAS